MKSPVKPSAAAEAAAKKLQAEEAAWQAQLSERASANAVTTEKARRAKLEKLARREPMVRELLEDRDTLAAAGRAFAAERQQLENVAADLRAQLEALTAENAALKSDTADLRSQLAAAKAEQKKK